jgi:hypothetical protein
MKRLPRAHRAYLNRSVDYWCRKWARGFTDPKAAFEILSKLYQAAKLSRKTLRAIAERAGITHPIVDYKRTGRNFDGLLALVVSYEDSFRAKELDLSRDVTSKVKLGVCETDQIAALDMMFGSLPVVPEDSSLTALKLSAYHYFYFPHKYLRGLSSRMNFLVKHKLPGTMLTLGDVEYTLRDYQQYIINSGRETPEHARFFRRKRQSGSFEAGKRRK